MVDKNYLSEIMMASWEMPKKRISEVSFGELIDYIHLTNAEMQRQEAIERTASVNIL